jgi:hypothetical protein
MKVTVRITELAPLSLGSVQVAAGLKSFPVLEFISLPWYIPYSMDVPPGIRCV